MTSDPPGLRHLLIATDDTLNGGTAHLAHQLALALRRYFTVDFASNEIYKDDRSRAELRDAGIRHVNYSVVASKIPQQLYCRRTTRALLAHSRPDIILCVGSNILSLLALKRMAIDLNIPLAIVVNSVQDHWPKSVKPFIPEAKRCLDKADCVVLISKAHQTHLQQSLGRIATRLHVVSNFCSDLYFAPRNMERRSTIRRSLNIKDPTLVCFTAARISPQKGTFITLQALDTLRNKQRAPDFHVVFAGSAATPADHRAVNDYIAQRRLSGCVTILGERHDIPDLLDASDCAILPSFDEGAPLAIIEAMAKGVPVVASNVGDIAEMLSPSSGVLLPSPASSPDDCIHRLVDTLEHFAANPSQLAQMGRQARLRALDLFAAGAITEQYRNILESFQATTSAARPFVEDPLTDWRTINFADPSQAWDILVDGWSESEPKGVWSEGTVSTLRLEFSSVQRWTKLRFLIKPFIHPRCSRQVTHIWANDVEVGVWDIARRGSRFFDVDIDLDRVGTDVQIKFVHQNAISPFTLGISDDERALSLFVKRLCVLPKSMSVLDTLRFAALRSASVFR